MNKEASLDLRQVGTPTYTINFSNSHPPHGWEFSNSHGWELRLSQIWKFYWRWSRISTGGVYSWALLGPYY